MHKVDKSNVEAAPTSGDVHRDVNVPSVTILVPPSTHALAEPKDIFPTLTTQPVDKANDQAAPALTSDLQAKATSQAELPISTTQLADKTNYEATPDVTDGYQDTIATSPTNVVPQVAHSLNPATRLKHKLQYSKDLIVCPGVYDGLSARIAQAAGFETLYMVWQRPFHV